ncbi:cupin domain-containing protein [Ohtaekwangia koreensis]|uniref:Cupin domain-containing protein n=1 Tax=Ohtaekwangia koreensis TaxID=688867 RepID=A0A1T5LA88_9BACT|nr:cupin domain-containing protein [Ohtaekwangia koreensis]SKC72824.1 Cupin domain-containing protein [Ohtaekwangia koreensis]
MKRTSFLRHAAALATVLITPVVTQAKRMNPFRTDKGFKVDAGKDRNDKSTSLFEGDTFFTKISPSDSNGDLYVFESTRVKKGGPSFHFHYDQDEWWYVLQGEFQIKIGEETYHAKPGDSVFGPRMVPHTFAKISEGEAKLLMIFQPAGKMEEFFKATSEGVLEKMSEAERNEYRKKHGFERVGPPLGYLKQ